MRKKIIVGNWKMNSTIAEATVLSRVVSNQVERFNSIEVVLAPPVIWLTHIREVLGIFPPNFSLSAQNASWKQEGALTGEISPMMLKHLVKYVILGHSERRTQFHETPELISDKVRAVLDANLKPIICVGELSNAKESATLDRQIKEQFGAVLKEIKENELSNIVFAYEPLWAIGTGKSASGQYASKIISSLRKLLASKFSPEAAEDVSFLYGGSVNSKNIQSYISQPEIDGALVGGASLMGREFLKICNIANEEY